jgi:hypothetical protein
MAKIKKARNGVDKTRSVERSPDGNYKLITKTKVGPGIKSKTVKEKLTTKGKLNRVFKGIPKTSGVMNRKPVIQPLEMGPIEKANEFNSRYGVSRKGSKISKAKSGIKKKK